MNLYQEHILEHYHDPHHHGTLDHPTHRDCANNPTCGDKICIDLIVKDDVIQDIAFSGEGCAISQAAASMLTDAVVEHPTQKLATMDKGDILALLGLELSPARLKCALLGLEVAQRALQKNAA